LITGTAKTAEEYAMHTPPYDLWNYLDIQSYVIREAGNVSLLKKVVCGRKVPTTRTYLLAMAIAPRKAKS